LDGTKTSTLDSLTKNSLLDKVQDGHELLHCMEKIVEEQKTRRLFFVLAVMSTVSAGH
jgi:hypothetical protein